MGKGKLYTSSPANTPLMFQPTGALPVDNRQAVDKIADLWASNTFKVNGNDTSYADMVVSVDEDHCLYILKQKPCTTSSNWKKIGDTVSEITDGSTQTDAPTADAVKTYLDNKFQALAGVFQFKGVADAIDADHTTITLKSGTKTVTGSDPVVGYVCNGFYYDVAHDKYYEWTKGTDTIYVKGTEVYTKSDNESSALVYYVDYANTRYYVHDVSNGKITSFQSLDGGIIYPAGDGVNSETATTFYADSSKTVSVGSLTPHSYPAYTFTLVSGVTFDGSAITPGEGASGNTGHVYQIGEKEYASNGLIWVELGSPKEEITWLVINS